MRGRDTAGKGLSVRDKIAVVLCLLLALLLAVVPACGGDSKEDAPDQQVVKGQTPPSDAPDLSQQGDVSGQSEADQQPDGVDDRQPPVQQEEDADQTSAGAIAPPDFDGGDGTGDRSNSAEEAENPAQEGEPTQPAPPPSAGEVTGPTCTLLIECSAVLDHMGDLDPDKKELIPQDGVMLQMEVALQEGDTAYDVLERAAKQEKLHLESSVTPAYNSVYIEGIGNLYEFDCGNLSGWIYFVNGESFSHSASKQTVQAGDKVAFRYTCDLGQDLQP